MTLRKAVLTLGLAVLALVVARPESAAATRNYRFQRISLDQGLSQGSVPAIVQDRHGFMWFGTLEGLNRFDGYEFTVFQHDPADPSSLSHDSVWAILEDSDGTLWVGTVTGGLDRFNPADGTFTHFRQDTDGSGSTNRDRIRVLLEDEDGQLWIGTDGGGLSRFDRESETFTVFLPDAADPTSLSGSHVRDLYLDSNGELWVASDGGGLSLFDRSSGGFRHYRHDPDDAASLSSDRVLKIYEDRRGAMWIGTTDGGLNAFDRTTGAFRRYGHGDGSGLSRGAVRAIFEDDLGTLLVGTENGLAEWNPASGRFQVYHHDPTDPHSLSSDVVMSIYQDRGGVVWIGTYDGLNKWNPSTGTFPHHKAAVDEPDKLSNNYVTSFAERSDGTIWVGTLGGGLNAFSRADGTFRRYRHDPQESSSLASDRVMSLMVDRQDRTWVGMIDGGLDLFDPETGRFRHYRNDPSDPSSLSFDGVTALHQDRHGAIWAGAYRGGLNRLDPGSSGFRRYRHDPADPSSLSTDRVVAIFEDAAGTLWVGTDGGGLNRLDAAADSFTRYLHDPTDSKSLSSDHVFSISEGPDGDLWVGTQGGGLNRWKAADRKAGRAVFRRFLKADGLRSDVIYSQLWDDGGTLWVSTNRGLAALDPATGTFRNYNTSHGLQSEEFNFAAALRARDGQMFFGGINGFNAFFPEQIRTNRHVPPVELTAVLLSNRTATFDRGLADLDEIEVGYQDRVVTLDFAALDFTASEKNRYRYMLEGFDDNWVDLGYRHRVTYTNLPAGEYTFKVRAANNDGVWNLEGLSVRLRYLPPPWATWWAYAGYSMVAAILVLVYARSQIRKRERAAELARTNCALEQEIGRREAKEQALEREKLTAQRERARAQKYFQVADVIMLVLDPEGRVRLINSKGSEILGLEAPEIQGANWFDRFVPPESREDIRRRFFGRRANEYVEYPVVTRDGDERIIAWHTTYLTDESGAPAGTLSSGSDITPIRNLKRAKESAESANRAKSQFLANMSHEIRTPMNGVLGMTELLLDTDLTARQRDHATKARRSALNLLGIIDDILDFSKIEAGKLEVEIVDLDLRQLVSEAVEAFDDPAGRKGLELTSSIEAGLPGRLCGDPTRLRQVLFNLMANAIKFTDTGSVEVRALASDVSDASARVRFEVRDTGIGIEADKCEAVFESFQQADGSTTRTYGGTGLGLAISKQLVEMMGGEIGVDSIPGQGSTFWFTIDFARQEAEGSTGAGAADQKVAAHSHNLSLSGLRLLLVEDNPINQDVVRGMLEGLGGEIEVTCNGAEAVAAVEDRPYDLILMDCQMPTMDGYSATRAIRRLDGGTRVPIVAMTASTLAGDRQRCLTAGMDDYLAKPFTREGLLSLIARFLSQPPEQAVEGGAGGLPPSPTPLPRALAETEPSPINRVDQNRYLWQSLPVEGARKILETYLEASPALVESMASALGTSAFDTLASLAHRFTSNSAMVGASRLGRISARLDVAARVEEAGEAAARLRELRSEFERVNRALERDLAALEPPTAQAI